MTTPLRNYTRWVQVAGPNGSDYLVADIFGSSLPDIIADHVAGLVRLNNIQLSPDEARLIGVRLIEGAALADSYRAIRAAHPTTNPGPGDETPDSVARPGRTPEGQS